REIAGTVRALERRIAAIAFDAVEELDLVAVLRHERAEARTHVDAQHEIGMRMTYFMPASAHHDREIARCGERRLIEPAKRQVGSYVQLQLVPGEHLVAHAYGVVIVRHHDGFLEHASFVLEPPDRNAIVHPKLRQVAMRFAYHPF